VSARHRTAEELLERAIRDMGDELGPVYHELSNGLSRLHVKWRAYRQLYTRSPERIDLINKAAGWFFKVVQGALVGDVLLHIGRLTDLESIGRRDNLTIRRLPPIVPDALRGDIDALLAAVLTACEPIRTWRNRRGAHTDLDTAILGVPTPGITNEQVETVLASLRALLNRIEQHYWRAPTMYEHIVTPPGDADSLVYYLLKGIRADEARHQRLRDGKPTPEDLRNEELP
jgi:AbiU2